MQELLLLVDRCYGFRPDRIEPLDGYEDKTYRLRTSGADWILKEHPDSAATRLRIAREDRLMNLHAVDRLVRFPRHAPTLDGELFAEEGGKLYRLLSFLEGRFLAQVAHSPEMMESLGALLGRMAVRALSMGVVEAPVAPSDWDLQHLGLLRRYLQEEADPHLRSLIAYFIDQFEAQVWPVRSELRYCMIHNDANDWNILVRDNVISGLFDFGDHCYSWMVNDLAVGLTYMLLDKDNLLETVRQVVSAFSRELPLKAAECDALYWLVAGRLCMSLLNSAHAMKQQPDNTYIPISRQPAERLLHSWLQINPVRAKAVIRQAAGLQPEYPPDTATFEQRRRRVLSPALSLSYTTPIAMQRAAFQYMYDTSGETYLDAYNNIMLVGHCHPHVVSRSTSVMRRLNTNTRYHYDELLAYTERLLEHFPPALSRVFLVNSGSAATDLAIRLARHYTGRRKVLALEHGYHGNTETAISISHYKHRPETAYPDTLLCPMPKAFGTDNSVSDYASAGLRTIGEHEGQIAAFIAEPIMGCGGQVPLADGFLQALYPELRKAGALCISDEVQVGFGRLGAYFWGFEMYGVVPDMVVLGKPMGNGHPIGAVVCTAAIADEFASGPEFFSSFGGNPVSCATGLAVLEVLQQESLGEHAKVTGEYLAEGFKRLGSEFPVLADVRGSGLFLGVEVQLPDGRPGTRLANGIKNGLRERHILIGTDGPADNVLKIKPPLPFNRSNSDRLLEEMSRWLRRNAALKEYS